MKHIITLLLFASATFIARAQEGGLTIADHEAKIEWSKSDIENIESPLAATTCEEKEITWIYVDKEFSGGKNGVLERTWMAEDRCGNKASTVQYIVLRD